MGIRENFKRGSIEMLILYLLSQEDMYGYQLAQEINSRSEGQFDITEGSMYPTLYRLIEKKAISDYKKLSGKRRTRVYYHIEKEGVELLEKIKTTLDEIQGLREDLDDLLDNPGVTLENLERMRDTLSEIQGLKEDMDE